MAYNIGNFLRTLALQDEIEQWSMTTLREMLIKNGAKVVGHGRHVTFQLAEIAIPRRLFAEILRLIDGLRPKAPPRDSSCYRRNRLEPAGARLSAIAKRPVSRTRLRLAHVPFSSIQPRFHDSEFCTRRVLGRTERPIPRPRTGLQDHAFDQNTNVLLSSVAGRNQLGNPGSRIRFHACCRGAVPRLVGRCVASKKGRKQSCESQKDY